MKNENLRKLLEVKGYSPEEIEATLKLTSESDKRKKEENIRSWISVVISFIALLVSFIAVFLRNCK